MKKSVLFGLAALLMATPAFAARITSIRVIDGDTLRINGTHTARLLDIDSPEILKRLAKCPEELEAGQRAKARLSELMSPPHRVSVKYAKGKDVYGRSLIYAYSDGKNVSNILVNEGFAKPWKFGKEARPTFCR